MISLISSLFVIIEMIPEIKFAMMKLLIHSWEERLTCFDCKIMLAQSTKA